MPIPHVERREGTSHQVRPFDEEETLRATSSRVRLALAFGASGLLIAFPNHASAQVIDPSEIVEEKLDQVEKLVGETSDTVEEALHKAEEKVDETVGEAKETVDEVVDETVGQLEPPGQPEPPTEPKGGNLGDPAPSGNEEQPKVEPRTAPQVESVAQGNGDQAARSNVVEPLAPRAIEVAPATELAARTPDVATPPVTPGDAAQTLAFPILMAGAVLMYLFLQGRFDRRDPKLLFDIDVDDESLSFE